MLFSDHLFSQSEHSRCSYTLSFQNILVAICIFRPPPDFSSELSPHLDLSISKVNTLSTLLPTQTFVPPVFLILDKWYCPLPGYLSNGLYCHLSLLPLLSQAPFILLPVLPFRAVQLLPFYFCNPRPWHHCLSGLP